MSWAEVAAEREAEDRVSSERLFGSIPLLTFGVVIGFWILFIIQRNCAFDVGKGSEMSAAALTALGASSRALTLGQHEYWRMFLAPMLHSSTSHVLGNSVALALLGYYLELRVGRAWFLAVFFFSALTGGVGSLINNPPQIVTVGASGAITGLLGAVFVLSFHSAFDAQRNRAMRIMAMRWAVPALGPLVWGAHGHTDYAAHLGGALGGAAIGVLLLAIWDGVSFRPPHGRAAGLFAALFLLGSASGIGFAAAGYNKVRAASAQFIPLSESPANLDVGAEKAGDFLRRYPDDPRSHLFGAMAALKRGEGFVAEEQLRRTLAMATKPEQEVLRHLASGVLAAVYAERHDWRQVKLYGREVCDEKRMEPDMVQLRKMLKKAKACL